MSAISRFKLFLFIGMICMSAVAAGGGWPSIRAKALSVQTAAKTGSSLSP